jgi:hypothetical protein
MPTLATMFTMTTYGTWLRGDPRNWVDNNTIFPPNPPLEAADRARMKHPEFRFPTTRLHDTAHTIPTPHKPTGSARWGNPTPPPAQSPRPPGPPPPRTPARPASVLTPVI